MLNLECVSVKNKKTYKGDGFYMGRPSPLGNPFSHEDGTLAEFKVKSRGEAIERYRDWLLERLDSDNPTSRMFMMLLDYLRENGKITLICWCVPLGCHCNVIKELLLECVVTK